MGFAITFINLSMSSLCGVTYLLHCSRNAKTQDPKQPSAGLLLALVGMFEGGCCSIGLWRGTTRGFGDIEEAHNELAEEKYEG